MELRKHSVYGRNDAKLQCVEAKLRGWNSPSLPMGLPTCFVVFGHGWLLVSLRQYLQGLGNSACHHLTSPRPRQHFSRFPTLTSRPGAMDNTLTRPFGPTSPVKGDGLKARSVRVPGSRFRRWLFPATGYGLRATGYQFPVPVSAFCFPRRLPADNPSRMMYSPC